MKTKKNQKGNPTGKRGAPTETIRRDILEAMIKTYDDRQAHIASQIKLLQRELKKHAKDFRKTPAWDHIADLHHVIKNLGMSTEFMSWWDFERTDK